MLNTELKKRRKQSLRQTIKGGAPAALPWTPYEAMRFLREWQVAYTEKNADKMIKLMYDYRPLVLALSWYMPAEWKAALGVLFASPKTSVAAIIAAQKLFLYNPYDYLSVLGL